jgi:hypothetical protein
MTLLNEMQEKIDEKEFLSIVGKNAAYSVIISGILIGVIYWLVMSVFPWLFGAGQGVSSSLWIIMFVTVAVFCYVFKSEHTSEKVVFDKIATFIIWIFLSGVYAVVMYFCGEVIVISLMVPGIILTVLFLATDMSITVMLTVREIREKIKGINAVEESRKKEAEIFG